MSFVKRKGKPKGKPIGGDGGAGGDVVIEADARVASLLSLQREPHQVAERGTHGAGDLRHGRRGADRVVKVPLGTVVKDHEGTMLADLVQPGDRVVVARGGRGGRGNAAFAGPRHRAPAFSEQGEYGERVTVELEVKLLADAALIGFPNAGKSTLIAAVSAARPKIADYPFTTLEPHLGVVAMDGREFVLADIPGLIEGASEGRGLGHDFLRHVERARTLVVLLDPSSLQPHPPADQYRILLDELGRHQPELIERPRVVAVSKIDLLTDEELAAVVEAVPTDLIHPVSAVTRRGLPALLHAVADAVETAVRHAPDRAGFILHRPLGETFAVTRQGGVWVVSGRAAERAVAFDDLTRPETADLAARRLARLGVDDALRAAGARPGDDVRIGDLVFEYQVDDAEEGAEE